MSAQPVGFGSSDGKSSRLANRGARFVRGSPQLGVAFSGGTSKGIRVIVRGYRRMVIGRDDGLVMALPLKEQGG